MKIAIVGFMISLFALQAQDRTVAFSDEGRPRQLKIDLINGRIAVKGHAGKEAILQIDGGKPAQKDRNGWIRINQDISVTEQNNIITISGGAQRNANLTVMVPFQTSVQLRCVNCGDMRVEGVQGDLDVNNTNGSIHLMNVSGSVLAHSLNSSITAIIDKIDSSKSHSFTSMNGTIDCTFPADLKASVKMRTENGKIHTDYDIRLGGGTIMRTDRGISGSIGGGGPEIVFKAFNGSIFIRKKV